VFLSGIKVSKKCRDNVEDAETTNEDIDHHFLRYHFEFISQSHTVNQVRYMELMKRLREAVRKKTPEFWPNDWILHHDNAPAHTHRYHAVSCPEIYY
jgi:hypothetical protein